MESIFMPYNQNQPAILNIKGHRVLLLSSVPEDGNDILELSGADELREIDCLNNNEESNILLELASNIDGGVVLTPPEISAVTIIKTLEEQLPWVH